MGMFEMDRRSFQGSMFVLSLVLAASLARPGGAAECIRRYTAARSQPSIVETANFRIYGVSRLANAQAIGADLETLRTSLSRTWLGAHGSPGWLPKCDVVIHATVAGYLRAVGQDQFTTAGSSRVDMMGGRVTLRRLDILASRPGWFAAAVPHELTHVILADEFRVAQLPVWADEGMALLADTATKQSLHARDFDAGHQSGSTFRLASFVTESGYPSAKNVALFYGQSLSLVKYLVERRSPAEFVRFLHLAEKTGYDAALSEVYGLGGVPSLEREWLASIVPPPSGLPADTQPKRDLALVEALAMATTP